jgi:hypothetical protein
VYIKIGGTKMKWIWLSILVYFIGNIWDVVYHLNSEITIEYIPLPHAVMILGILLSAISVIRFRVVFKDKVKWLMTLNLIAVLVMTVGSLWDNFGYHIRGIEPAPNALPHLLLRYGGYMFLLFTIIITVVVFLKSLKIKRSHREAQL